MSSPRPSLGERIVYRLADMTVVNLLPAKAANLLQCRQQRMWDNYFHEAEDLIEEQWRDIIWPLIEDFDFGTVLELSPGGGRNTEKLAALTSRLIAVDYNQYALDRTRERLGTRYAGCQIDYHRNNGSDLAAVPDSSVTTVYCWDSAVHFDRDVVVAYIREFARVLAPGGTGFLHHSDLGDKASKNIKRNPHWRSNVDRELVAESCRENGLTVTLQQPVHWAADPGRGPGKARAIDDCITIFAKD